MLKIYAVIAYVVQLNGLSHRLPTQPDNKEKGLFMTVKNCRILETGEFSGFEKYDGVIVALEAPGTEGVKGVSASLEPSYRDAIEAFYSRTESKGKAGGHLSFDMSPMQRLGVFFEGTERSVFQTLGDARKLYGKLSSANTKSILLDVRLAKNPRLMVDAFCSVAEVGKFDFPKYGAKSKPAKELNIHVLCEDGAGLDEVMNHAFVSAECSNLSRELTMRAGNDLTPENYVSDVRGLAEKMGVGFEFIDYDKLVDMKAGAFVAVAQGSPSHDAGIVKLAYNSESSEKHLVLVGKGITYDTGGTNLKPAKSMFGMQGDMAGSALALSVFQLAVKEKWPEKVSCYLAISDNSIGDEAYRPNDVVTSLKGKTIEVVHTDAEGRMVLADTLHLASQEKGDLMMDFATLTGACVGAIGTAYSGAFTNREDLHQLIIDAGRKSGERVWPFPLDEDFGECLESDIADIKQCRLTGGVDHIEAAYFLKQFVDETIPWIHIDLASSENSGGLAHVSSDCTGFGVRLCSQIVEDVLR